MMPTRMNSGAARPISNDSTRTIKVVPRFAPSITASVDEPTGGKARGHQPGRGAALQYRGNPDPGQKGPETVSHSARQQSPQVGSVGALNAALDHVDAPKQQRDRAG